MDVPARTTAALLLALATHGFASLPDAAAGQLRAGQSLAVSDAFTASSAQRRPSRWSRRKQYAGSETTVRQLSPTLRARALPSLRLDDRERLICGEASRRAPCASERNLADALIQPPSAATAKILRETGLPIIPGVPPIVIVRPKNQPGSAP